MKSLLLLDADIVIDLHVLGNWKAIVGSYKIHLPATVVSEIKHYPQGNQLIPIDLNVYINSGKVTVVSVDIQEQTRIFEQLRNDNVDGIDPGELEALCYMLITSDIRIALKDHAAIRAAAFLSITDRALSVEQVLKEVGILRVKDQVSYELSEERFRKFKTEGAFLAVEAQKKKPHKS